MGFLNPTFESMSAFYADRVGLDHAKLARRFGISRQTWWHYRKNPRQMTLGVFQEFCEVCRLSDSERLEVSKLCR